MANTEWLSPSESNSTSWSNYTRVYSEDGSCASYSVNKNSTSSAIMPISYNVSQYIVNPYSVINGIEVRVKRYASNSSSLSDGGLQLVVNGSASGNNKAVSTTWGTSNVFSQTFGGSSDLWGNSLTYSAVTASNFGVSLKVTNGTNGSRTAYVDVIQLRIYYTPPIEYFVSTNTNITCNPVWEVTPKIEYANEVDSTLLLI